MAKHILILGCGRSGTSIFGELFRDIPEYKYYSEPAITDLAHYNYSHPTAVKVPRSTHDFPPTEGLSFLPDHLYRIFPVPRQLYWIVRHPLDTICSLKVGIAKNWGHHPRPLDWQTWLDRPLIQRCAHHWNYINTLGYDRLKDLVAIKYFEDLIRNPAAFTKQICKEAEIDLEKNLPAINRWAGRVQNTNNAKFIEAVTSRPYSTNDHTVRVNRWRENLSKEEYELVVPLVQEAANSFGYKIPEF